MAAISLRDMGKAIFVTRPRRGGVYLKKWSYPKGATPKHLEPYTEKFSKQAKDCVKVMANLQGNEKVEAFNACIGTALEK